MNQRIWALASAAALLFLPGAACSTPIAAGESITGINIPGAASVYQIFGRPGNPGGDTGPATDAYQITFKAGSGNVFTFSATGLVSCCSDTPNLPPDGGKASSSIGGANGLSGIIGNSNVPLVGVFTTDADPAGTAAPAALTFDKEKPQSLSPALGQVFYIGDGKSGYLDSGGSPLTFTAPEKATRLYLGVIDALSFKATTGSYNDNRGAFTVTVRLTQEAGNDWWLLALLLVVLGMALVLRLFLRNRKRASPGN